MSLCIVILGWITITIITYINKSVRIGIGGDGFVNIFAQCMFKSYASVDDYHKTGKMWTNPTSILKSDPESWSGYFSSHFPTDKQDRHNYTLYYDMLFEPFVNKEISILEIGVKKGGSLKLWRELFSSSSSIFGIDIDPAVPTFVRDGKIKVLVMDSRNTDYLQNSLKGINFDIIIDDGDHRASAQSKTFQNLVHHLKPTGVYIIEDVYHFYPNAFYGPSNISWSLHADKSLEEEVVFIYPQESIAPHLTPGLKKSSWT